ncbi:calcium-binding protein [Inquilinus limosus]|uniref:calcium-binding protein n=1 Tax=Inquilinus limosus TaxID=171674 RepID=UPI00041015DA|nr:calcium-binding protein [Inquilinus limosus]
MANFEGTAGADIIPPVLTGAVVGIGNDTISGLGGNDLIAGYSGNDVISGGTGADVIIGGILNVVGGIGSIQLSGVDTADYSTSASAVFVNLASTGALDIDILGINLGLTGVTTGRGGDAEGDSLVGMTSLTGSAFDDYLGGNVNENTLIGGAGNDNLAGNGGADVLNGGAGTQDMADYISSNAGVTVSLVTGTGTGGHAAGDTLTGIEWLRGSAFNDALTGDGNANRLSGLAGTDTLDGGAGNDQLIGGAGQDTLTGGAGFDTALYDNASAGVTASLLNPAANNGDAAGDSYSSIENLVGSAFNDVLTGDNGSNYLQGWRGDDTLNGRGGADILHGGAGADTFVFSSIADASARAPDVIRDFSQSQGDTIDVSGITGGNGSFIGTDAFSGVAGEVRINVGVTQTAVYIDANGDGTADAQVRLTGGAVTLTADDFVL